jgi:hypothetical protein
MTVLESEGPMAILHVDSSRGLAYRAICRECPWAGHPRRHRIDAEDDFDNHTHQEIR